MILSCAEINASFFFCANSRTFENSVGLAEFHTITRGIRPLFKKNGAYPVLSDLAELIANCIAGNLLTQSFCFGLIH